MNWFVHLFEVMQDILLGFAPAVTWLFTDFDLGFVTMSPIYILSFGSLIIFLPIAIAKWFIS